MKKRLIALILVFICTFNFFSLGSFGATDQETYTGNQLRILGILKGYSDGSLKLDSNINRAEVAALTVRILGYENTIIVGNEKDFTDVEKAYWAYNNIQNAYKLSIIMGYPTGVFKPKNNISYAEVVTIMVNSLGQGTNLEGTWPENYIEKAKTLGIIPTDSAVDSSKIVTRGEMAVIVWNTLLVKK